MAIWQFRFSLVPEVGIVHVHKRVPPVIDAFRATEADATSWELASDLPYWEAKPPRSNSTVMSVIGQLLPAMESWSEDALIFGYKHGHQVEVWTDDLICKFDARDPDTIILKGFVACARELACKCVLHEDGRVLDPVPDIILQAYQGSRACRFNSDPAGTLRDLLRDLRGRGPASSADN